MHIPRGQLILRKIDKIGATMQMSDFKAKMHQIRCPLKLCPRRHWGAHIALPVSRAPQFIHSTPQTASSI